MRGSVKAWLPATVVAVFLAIGVGTAAYFTLGRSLGSSPSPTPTVDLHSKEAIMAAVKAYYKAEDKAGETGDVSLVGSETTGPGTPAYENLRAYLAQQLAKNRGSVITSDDFTGWNIVVAGNQATAAYGIVQHGYDIDLTTRQPVEAQTRTPKGLYKATLMLQGPHWRLHKRDLITHEPT